MNAVKTKNKSIIRTILVDVIILTVICLVPAISHAVAMPLYKVNPMLICLLAGSLLVNDRRNALLLAIIMPFLSSIITGYPIASNLICMIPELLAVVLLIFFLEKKAPTFVAVLMACLGGKVVFYTLRASFFSSDILFGTNLWLQIGLIVLFSAVYALIKVGKKRY